MKRIIKKVFPKSLKQLYIKYTYSGKKSPFFGKTVKEAFTQIYETNQWQGVDSVSGTGSDASQTKIIIDEIGILINELNIKTVLDLPCGDFVWMKNIDLSDIKYIGGDIVDNLIEQNSVKYAKRNNIRFEVMDLINDKLPQCELIINRDCLVHLSHDNIYKSIQNIKSSGSKYLSTTTYTKHNLNYNITTGDWRTLNLQKKPFNFPPPIKAINEGCSEDGGELMDKSLAIWRIEDIKLPPSEY